MAAYMVARKLSQSLYIQKEYAPTALLTTPRYRGHLYVIVFWLKLLMCNIQMFINKPESHLLFTHLSFSFVRCHLNFVPWRFLRPSSQIFNCSPRPRNHFLLSGDSQMRHFWGILMQKYCSEANVWQVAVKLRLHRIEWQQVDCYVCTLEWENYDNFLLLYSLQA